MRLRSVTLPNVSGVNKVIALPDCLAKPERMDEATRHDNTGKTIGMRINHRRTAVFIHGAGGGGWALADTSHVGPLLGSAAAAFAEEARRWRERNARGGERG